MTRIVELVWAFIQVGVTAFGGGLSTLPLMEYQLVIKNAWMDSNGFNQMVALSQVTPGPIAINAATFAGYKQAGIAGSLAATLAIVAAPVLILTVILIILRRVSPEKSKEFKILIRPIVAGLLTLSIVSPFTSTLNNGAAAVALFAVGVALIKFNKFFKENPAVMLIIFGLFGAVFLR